MEWWYNDIWVHLLVFVWYGDTGVQIWTGPILIIITQRYVYCILTEVFLNLTEVLLTLAEGFPCISLSCKANARVKLAKTGHGPHSSTLVCIWVVRLLFVLFYVLLVCVNVYCHRVTTQLQLIKYIKAMATWLTALCNPETWCSRGTYCIHTGLRNVCPETKYISLLS